MGRLDGQVAVITGGGSGIGRDTALTFLREGASVVIGDLNGTTLDETVQLAGQLGVGDQIAALQGNVTSEPDVEALIELAIEKFGRLDCIFNNAGVGGAMGSVTETLESEYDITMDILVKGVFFGMKHAARAMKKQGEGGSIISTSSVAGMGGGAGPHIYSAAKAAVANLTKSVAIELAADRIRVNAIAPGGILTPLLGSNDPEAREMMRNHLISVQPWPEAGEAQDIANVALFLASSDANFITGQTIIADGGLLAKGPALFSGITDVSGGGVAGVSLGNTGLEGTSRTVETD